MQDSLLDPFTDERGEYSITSLFFSCYNQFEPRVKLSLSDGFTPLQILNEIKTGLFPHSRWNIKNFKLYTFQGMELEPAELLFLENNSHIFVSPNKEEYDGNMAMKSFKMHELLGQVFELN